MKDRLIVRIWKDRTEESGLRLLDLGKDRTVDETSKKVRVNCEGGK